MAEFENYKKRSSKERESLYGSILGDVIEVILPVLDNLENAAKVETSDENYKKGIELVLKQFQDVLKSTAEAEKYGYRHQSVARAARGERKSYKNIKWKYVDRMNKKELEEIKGVELTQSKGLRKR